MNFANMNKADLVAIAEAQRNQIAQMKNAEQAPWYEQMIDALAVTAEVEGRDGPYQADITVKDTTFFAGLVANALLKKIEDGKYGLEVKQAEASARLMEALRRRDGTEISMSQIQQAKTWLAARNEALAVWQDAFDFLKLHVEESTGKPLMIWGRDAQSNVSATNGDVPVMSEAEKEELRALGIDPDAIEIGDEMKTDGISTAA